MDLNKKDALSAPSLPAGGSGRAGLERLPTALTGRGAGKAAVGLASEGTDGEEWKLVIFSNDKPKFRLMLNTPLFAAVFNNERGWT